MKRLYVLLIVLSILCMAPTNLNRARIIFHHGGDWTKTSYATRFDALPTTDNIIAIGDSAIQRFWVTDKAGATGACALKINNQIDNQSANTSRFVEEVRPQYRDDCCSGGNDCATSNSCTYDWIIVNGGGNDLSLNASCAVFITNDNCMARAACKTEVDNIIHYEEGTDTWTGQLYNLLGDISYQASGDKNVVYLCLYSLEMVAYKKYENCLDEYCTRATLLAESHSDDWPSGVSFYVVKTQADYNMHFDKHPDYYDDDGIHFLFYGTTAYGNAIANIINTH